MMLPVVNVIAPHWKLLVLPSRKCDSAAQALDSEAGITGFELSAVEMGLRPAGNLPDTRRRQAGRPVLLWRVMSRSRRLRAGPHVIPVPPLWGSES
jgi:hypothetical protein